MAQECGSNDRILIFIEYLVAWLFPLLMQGLMSVVWSHFNLMSKQAECLCIYFWEWDDWNLSHDADSLRKCYGEMRDEY